MYVPDVPKVKLLILDESHKTPYSGHPGYQKTNYAKKIIFLAKYED